MLITMTEYVQASGSELNYVVPLFFVFPDTFSHTKKVLVVLTVNLVLVFNFEIPDDGRNIFKAFLAIFSLGLVPSWLDPVSGSTAVTGPTQCRRIPSWLDPVNNIPLNPVPGSPVVVVSHTNSTVIPRDMIP